MIRLFPRNLMGQMLLAVAVALLLVQGIGAALVYRAQKERFDAAVLNAAAFRIVADERGSDGLRFRMPHRHNQLGDGPPRKTRIEHHESSPIHAGERRDERSEEALRRILADQDVQVADVVVTRRRMIDDPVALKHAMHRAIYHGESAEERAELRRNRVIVFAVRPADKQEWTVVRVPTQGAEGTLLKPLIAQTLIIYLVVVGVVAFILRRITRPLAALTRQVQQFAATRDPSAQVEPSGPDDIRHLIEAHNAMESRISAMLDEKDVMLGAIGHDLKTPLAALRVRIESVEDDVERGRMAATIEDIVRTLDDILSLARVGRPSDPVERTELSALVASVVEEYEDMGEPVELGETERMALELRPTWLRRALRNLVGNAVRYGTRARVSLQKQGNRAVILISDDGPGIPENSIAEMTNPFTRGDPSRNTETGGAGLGLALARAIADQHGGQLVLANRRTSEGQVAGLDARIELPLA